MFMYLKLDNRADMVLNELDIIIKNNSNKIVLAISALNDLDGDYEVSESEQLYIKYFFNIYDPEKDFENRFKNIKDVICSELDNLNARTSGEFRKKFFFFEDMINFYLECVKTF